MIEEEEEVLWQHEEDLWVATALLPRFVASCFIVAFMCAPGIIVPINYGIVKSFHQLSCTGSAFHALKGLGLTCGVEYSLGLAVWLDCAVVGAVECTR